MEGCLNPLTNPKNIIVVTVLINLLSILLKLLVGQFGYSGEGDKPKFGDYEAQRHWMELTANLHVTQWYTNSENNPKDYWPLDYPPVSGYYSYFWGMVFKHILPESVMLKDSWGFESSLHKQYMRLSVIISDLVFYHIPVILLCYFLFRRRITEYYTALILFLLCPLFILIDHGHFQYNCVMHGLFILSVYLLYNNQFTLTVFTFAFCINFKQMGLYYAIPFPVYVIKKLYHRHGLSFLFIFRILSCGIVTLLSMILIWLPWISNYNDVVSRIFPIWRGIFEDKVKLVLNPRWLRFGVI
jgi:alpha-1,3-glucosyltransferase